MVVGTEAKETGLEHRPGSDKGPRGEDTPSEPKSSRGDDKEEDDEEGVITPPPHSPPLEDLPSLGDLFSRQAEIFAGPRRSKRPRTEIGPSISPPPQFDLALVSFDLQGVSVALVVTGIAHLLGVL
jgi:hypothetical protein